MARKREDTTYLRVYQGLGAPLPQFAGFCLKENDDFTSLQIRQRGQFDFMAVLKGVDADGSPVVLFGTGYDFVGALLGLEGALAANRWKTDVPWDGE